MAHDAHESDMSRRRFLAWAGTAGLASGWHVSCRRSKPSASVARPEFRDWSQVRLVRGELASPIERTCLDDAAQLLFRATGHSIPVLTAAEVLGSGGYRPQDIVATCPQSSPHLPATWACQSQIAGSFRTAWAASILVLPREDSAQFAQQMRTRLRAALAAGTKERASGYRASVEPWTPAPLPASTLRATIAAVLSVPLPEPLAEPPAW